MSHNTQYQQQQASAQSVLIEDLLAEVECEVDDEPDFDEDLDWYILQAEQRAGLT